MGEVDPIEPIVEEYCGTGLIGDFVEWVTKRLPKVSALDVCYATNPGVYEYFCCHTTDPYVPTYQLLELIGTLLQSREVMSVYADSAYRWLPSSIKQRCPAAKVYSPTSLFRSSQRNFGLPKADFWQDSLFQGSYQPIDTLGELSFDAVAIVEYEERHDQFPGYTYPDVNEIYYQMEFIQELAGRVNNGGVVIWVDCEFDLKKSEPRRRGQGIHACELRTTLASIGFQLDAVFESNILSGDTDRPASEIVSAMVYVFEKTDQRLYPAAYDARSSIPFEERFVDNEPRVTMKDAPGIAPPIAEYRTGQRKHRIVDDLFPGIKALEHKRRLKQITQENGFKLVPWLEVFEPGGIGLLASSEEKRDSGRMVTVHGDDGWPIYFFARNQSDQEYLQKFFRSELGRLFISSCAMGRSNLKNWVEFYEASKIPMPKDVGIRQEIVRSTTMIDEIENQLRDHARQVWTGDLSAIRRIRNQLDFLKSGDSTDWWSRTLCLPLASILVPYSISQTESNNEKVKRLLRFFESLTAWLAVINLSIAKKDSTEWQEVISSLSGQKQHLSFRALTFGGWRTIFEVVLSANRSANRINASSLSTLNEIRPVLNRVNQVRNEWDGHGGLEVGSEVSRSRLDELNRRLTEARKYLDHVLTNYRLVVPGRGEQTDEGYLCSFEELTGPSAPFPTIERLLSCPPPVKGRLYLLEDDTSSLIELLPLVRVDDYKVYFYGRYDASGYTFVSHHNPDVPEKTIGRDQAPELTKLFDSLG